MELTEDNKAGVSISIKPPGRKQKEGGLCGKPRHQTTPVPYIIRPVKVGQGKYEWKELEVKNSNEENAGTGVFATRDLPVGVMIPICGKLHEGKMGWLSHGWQYRTKRDQYIDGDPSVNPFKGIGCYGLAVAMMLNERTLGVHNCLFILDYIVVATPVVKGEELTVYYGKDYKGIRDKKGYTLEHNKNLLHGYPLNVGIVKYPSTEERQKEYNALNKLIKECNEEKTEDL